MQTCVRVLCDIEWPLCPVCRLTNIVSAAGKTLRHSVGDSPKLKWIWNYLAFTTFLPWRAQIEIWVWSLASLLVDWLNQHEVKLRESVILPGMYPLSRPWLGQSVCSCFLVVDFIVHCIMCACPCLACVYTNGGHYPMLAQVVYHIYTTLLKIVSHIHHFAKYTPLC